MKKYIYILFSFLTILIGFLLYNIYNPTYINNTYTNKDFDALKIAAPNIQLYEYLKRETTGTNISFQDNLRLAYFETTFRGVHDYKYKPFRDGTRVSSQNAFGPMQIQLPTARQYLDVTAYELQYNIEKNVKSSVEYQKDLMSNYSRLKTYSIYNQGWIGKKNINEFAKNIAK